MVEKLKNHFNIKFTNDKGRCAHEFIIDFAEYEKTTGLKVMDFAKRLQVRFRIDYMEITSQSAWTGLRVSSTNLFLAHFDLHVGELRFSYILVVGLIASID
jgi:hypothetical protein